MGCPLARRARRYLPILCLALFLPSLQAQSGTYASSAEYQGMLEELRAPAPSPIYLATGQRPLPDDSLKVKQHNTRTALTLKTQSMEITIDRQTATLTLLNLQTRASWIFSLAGSNGIHAPNHHPPAKPMDHHHR